GAQVAASITCRTTSCGTGSGPKARTLLSVRMMSSIDSGIRGYAIGFNQPPRRHVRQGWIGLFGILGLNALAALAVKSVAPCRRGLLFHAGELLLHGSELWMVGMIFDDAAQDFGGLVELSQSLIGQREIDTVGDVIETLRARLQRTLKGGDGVIVLMQR